VTGLLLIAALSACPEAAGLERPEQQEAACALAQRRAAAPDRGTLSRVLAEPEFARARDRNANVFAVLWERFFAWLKHVFQTQEAATFAKAAPFTVLTLAFAIALLALLRFARFRRLPRPDGGPASLAPLALKPPPEHLANARGLLATAPREAIREGLLALLSSLERRDLARPDRVKTNRELCAELPARGADSALVAEVRLLVDWYDLAFYSLAPVSLSEARTFVEDVSRLVPS
jgi:hypothetical protein